MGYNLFWCKLWHLHTARVSQSCLSVNKNQTYDYINITYVVLNKTLKRMFVKSKQRGVLSAFLQGNPTQSIFIDLNNAPVI